MSRNLVRGSSARHQTLSARLETIRDLEEARSQRRKIPAQLIAEALIRDGYSSLDEQAKALGLNRSTAWTIVKTKHKLSCLNAKTARAILANPDTPISVRAIIHSILEQQN